MRILSKVFIVLAVLLSNSMFAVVAYNYCELIWCARYEGCSAPASMAFLYAIPYLIGIIVCVVLSTILQRKNRNI